MTLARWPNEGFVEIVDLVGGHPVDVRGTKGDRVGKFMYEGDRPKRWVQENDPWVHGYWFWDWSDQRQKVESIDTEKRIIAVAPPYHGYGYRKGQWFYAYNLLAEIDEPGEWYLDRQAGTLYFLPPSSMDGARSVVSVLPSLVTIRDASHITIEGLIFEAARATAVTVRGGTHVRIGRCTLRNLGAWAVQASGGTAHTVADCEIYGTGQGGISLSGGDRRTLTPAGHTAENNHVHHYSRWNRMYHPAVALEGVGNRAAHNLIHDAPHEAITFGGNDHVIELNEIHHVCEESNDAGAIYAGRDWTMRGTVIRHNFLHHISGFRGRGCVGVYLDDMFSGTVVSGNVFYQVTRAAFIGGGRDCDVTNNLFVDCTPALHIDARAMGWAADSVPGVMKERLDAMPYRQPPWSERYPKLLNTWEDEPAAPKGNRVARNACFGGRWDEVEARARPYVTFADNWVGDDGGFIDAANMNFQLRDDSPVYHHIPGFEKVPFAEMGLLRSRSAGASRWEAKIRQFEAHDRQEPPPKDGILFLGSSSIVLWDLEKSFPGLPAINRGFGGSQIADSVQFADRIALPYRPKVIVFYAGDNDIAAGKSPEQVAADYRALVRKVRAALPETRIVYIAIKPSIARWKLVEKMREANRLIRAVVAEDPRQVFVDVEPAMLGPDGKPRPELFRSDGLHLSAAGYELWSDQVRPHLGL